MIDIANSNTLLLFSDSDMEKLKNAKVSLGGIGGVGSIALEMMVRIGIGNFKISDPDKYEDVNMNRQIYATTDTIGQNKALAAKERMLKISPDANIQTFEEGINLNNLEKFCDGADVIMALMDKESVKVIIHKYAKKHKIPVVMGSRDSLESNSRWCVRGKVWDYKNNPDLPTFGSTNHPELDKYNLEDITPQMMSEYDKGINEKKLKFFKQMALNNPEMFKSISKEELLKKIENNNNYYNRHVCSVIANTAGCLSAATAIRTILGEPPEEKISVNLW